MSNVYTEDAQKFNLHLEWNDTRKEAYLYEKLPDGKVSVVCVPEDVRSVKMEWVFARCERILMEPYMRNLMEKRLM